MIKPGTHHWNAQQRVHLRKSGRRRAVDEEVSAAKAERVLVATTRSLTSGPLVARRDGRRSAAAAPASSTRSARIRRANRYWRARSRRARSGADLIVAIGGGSVIDCAKAMLLCLWRDIRAASSMDALLEEPPPNRAPGMPTRSACA